MYMVMISRVYPSLSPVVDSIRLIEAREFEGIIVRQFKMVSLLDSRDQVQVYLVDGMTIKEHGFGAGLDKYLQPVAQTIKVVVAVLKAIVRVQFKLYLVAFLFHLGIVLHVSTVKKVILVQSDIKGHDFVLIVARQVIRLKSALRGNCQLREHLLQFSLIFKHHQQTSPWYMMVKVLVVVVVITQFWVIPQNSLFFQNKNQKK